MTEVLRAYDEAAERLQPGREHFFESSRGGHLSRDWVADNFRRLWKEAGNGDPEGIVPYQLRNADLLETPTLCEEPEAGVHSRRERSGFQFGRRVR